MPSFTSVRNRNAALQTEGSDGGLAAVVPRLPARHFTATKSRSRRGRWRRRIRDRTFPGSGVEPRRGRRREARSSSQVGSAVRTVAEDVCWWNTVLNPGVLSVMKTGNGLTSARLSPRTAQRTLRLCLEWPVRGKGAMRQDDSHSAFVVDGRGECGVTDVLCLRHTAETAGPPNRQLRPRGTCFVPFVFSCRNGSERRQRRTGAAGEHSGRAAAAPSGGHSTEDCDSTGAVARCG